MGRALGSQTGEGDQVNYEFTIIFKDTDSLDGFISRTRKNVQVLGCDRVKKIVVGIADDTTLKLFRDVAYQKINGVLSWQMRPMKEKEEEE